MDATVVETPRPRRKRTPPPVDPVTGKFVKRGATLPALAAAPAVSPTDPYIDLLQIGGALPSLPPDFAADGGRRTADSAPDVGTTAVEVSINRPFRVWTAGPNMPREKIYMDGFAPGLRPRTDGAYYLTSPAQVEWAKRVLGRRFWPDTIPEGYPDQKCDTCGWKCRNYEAMNVHLNQAHGRPQAGA